MAIEKEKSVKIKEDNPVLKELKKLNVDVTIWQLTMPSQKHRQLLLEELNKRDLSPGTILEEMIALITSSRGTVTINSKDAPQGAMTCNNALYLAMTYLRKHVPSL